MRRRQRTLVAGLALLRQDLNLVSVGASQIALREVKQRKRGESIQVRRITRWRFARRRAERGRFGFERARANFFVQFGRFFGRRGIELAREDFAARVVLRERGAALAVPRECAHQGAMRFFMAGFQFDLARGIVPRARVLAVFEVMRREGIERFERLTMQQFAAHEDPFFKLRAFADEQVFQQFAAIQIGGLLQARDACGAICQTRM